MNDKDGFIKLLLKYIENTCTYEYVYISQKQKDRIWNKLKENLKGTQINKNSINIL